MSDTNLIKFGDYSPEQARAEAAELQTASYMKLEVGKNIIRVLPPPMGKNSPFVKNSQHYIKTPDKAKATVFVCPRVMANQPCPACQKADEYSRSAVRADQAKADDLWPTTQTLVNVIDRKNPEKGPRVLRVSKSVHKALTDLRESTVAGGNFVHPTEGFDIQITRVGTGKEDTKYTVLAARNATPLHPDVTVMQEWIDNQPDLHLLSKVPTFSEIMTMFGVVPTPAASPAGSPATRGGHVGDSVDAEFDEVS